MTRALERPTQYVNDPESTGYVAAIEAEEPSPFPEPVEYEPSSETGFETLFQASFLSTPLELGNGAVVLPSSYKQQLAKTPDGAEVLANTLSQDDPQHDYALARLSEYWADNKQTDHAYRTALSVGDTSMQLHALCRTEVHNAEPQLEATLIQKITELTNSILAKYSVKIGEKNVLSVDSIDNFDLQVLDAASEIIGADNLHKTVRDTEVEKYDADNLHARTVATELAKRAGALEKTAQ